MLYLLAEFVWFSILLKNFQKVRIAYAIQTLGIVGILAYDLVSKGMDGMKENPLWIMFIVSTTILHFYQ